MSSEDESEFKPRLRLAVDSERPTIHAVHLIGIEPGEEIPISLADNLQVMLETGMTKGSLLRTRCPTLFGQSGRSRNQQRSSPLPDTTPFEDQFFWTGYLDLTDGEQQCFFHLTQSMWVTGSDESVIHTTVKATLLHSLWHLGH